MPRSRDYIVSAAAAPCRRCALCRRKIMNAKGGAGAAMSRQLAVLDFDQTVVDADSDDTIIRMLSERVQPPAWAGGPDWTPYMNEIFRLSYEAGFTKEDILSRIGGMPGVPGVRRLLGALAAGGWTVVLLTDANSVFVHHWLKVAELEDKVACVITNPASWSAAGRLTVRPHTHQAACRTCPPNLCKRLALARFTRRRVYDRVVYAGDGSNDVCPMYGLRRQDLACPRRDSPAHRLLSARPCAAAVLPWGDHLDILRELLPDRPASLS